jgi:DNA-binding transcriptional LysR family regulator
MQWSDRIGRRIKLRDLHIFLAVARCNSMAKAAELLAVSQPVVSKTISELEHALGVRLLDRTFQGVEPTTYGRAIINCGIAVFDDLRRGVQEIEYLSDPTTGELRVGATLPLMEDLVPRVLEQLAAGYPRITCHTADADSSALIGLLRERKLDLVISSTWGSHFGDELDAEFLFHESVFVVAGLGSPWSRRRKINFGDLLEEPWVLPHFDSLFGGFVSAGFRRAGIALPMPRISSNSMAVRLRLVEGDRFLTLLPASMLHFGARRLRVKSLAVSLPLETQAVKIVTLRGRTVNPVAKLFTEQLRACIQPDLKNHRGFPSQRAKC